MARTLPWLSNRATDHTKNEKTVDRSSKRRKLAGPSSDDEDEAVAKGTTRAERHRLALREARTPSTSPPPEPPQEEFMLDGFDQDDMYIMVEDELLSMAQAFTQHLHHAEYIRMKNLAKSQNASAIQQISRPTDSRVAMRAETKKKKVAQERARFQSAALDELATKGQRKKNKQSLNGMEWDAEDDDLDDDDSDLWAGTSLQGLMTSAGKSKYSLSSIVGGVKSSGTRAAAGFARARANNLREGRRYAGIGNSERPQPPAAVVYNNSVASGEDDDDDLDAPVIRRNMVEKKNLNLANPLVERSHTISKGLRQRSPNAAPPYERSGWSNVKPSSDMVPPIKLENESPRFNPRSSRDNHAEKAAADGNDITLPFDHIPQPSKLSGQVSQRIQMRLAGVKAKKEEHEDEKKIDEKTRSKLLNEIPTFLAG